MINVSVIIPTYNYAQFIVSAITSVLGQSYTRGEIEIIVVDDGSTDDTQAVLKEFIDDQRIQYYFQENRGKAHATYVAIQKSKGKYIFTLDADDYFLRNKIDATVDVFEEDEEIVHVSSSYMCYHHQTKSLGVEKAPQDITGKPIDGHWLLHRFYENNILFGGGSTYAARASVLKKISIPGEVDMYIDEFLMLAILPFGKSYFIETSLSVWRIHSANYSGSAANRKLQQKKEQRLIRSSAAVFRYLQTNDFDPRLTKMYQLKDATRRIAFKETGDEKKFGDIFKYITEVFFKIQPGWKLIKKYHVMPRLLPTGLYRFLKRMTT